MTDNLRLSCRTHVGAYALNKDFGLGAGVIFG